jgi:phosphohistidine phosphatase
MELLLVRHAIAAQRAHDLPDAQRPLTDRGISRFRREVRGLARLELYIDGALHSPWLRAAQTAELLSPINSGPVRVTERLASDPDHTLLEEVPKTSGRYAIVGHEPWMGELCSLMVLGTVEHGDKFPFKKGGVAVLQGELAPGAMELRALFTPKSLRGIGK